MSASIAAIAQNASGEHQLRQFATFLSDHTARLTDLLTDDTHIDYHRKCAGHIDTIAPITIDFQHNDCDSSGALIENLSPFQLCDSENRILNKIILVFGQLCNETRSLRPHADRLQYRLLAIDDHLLATSTATTGDAAPAPTDHPNHCADILMKTSEVLEFLCEIRQFVMRCQHLAVAIYQQLCALFANGATVLNTNASIHFQSVFNYFADCLLYCEQFNAMLKRTHIVEHGLLAQLQRTIQQPIDRRRQDDESSVAVQQMVADLHQHLFVDDLVRQMLTALGALKIDDPLAIVAFGRHLTAYTKNQMTEFGRYDLTTLSEQRQSRELIKVNLMVVVWYQMCCVPSASGGGSTTGVGDLTQHVRQLCDFNQRYCSIMLCENTVWLPDAFLARFIVTPADATAATGSIYKIVAKFVGDAQRGRQTALLQRTQQFPRDIQLFAAQCAAWIVMVRRQFSGTDCSRIALEQLRERGDLLMDGWRLAGRITFTMMAITYLHVHLMQPMPKQMAANVCRLLEYLQIIGAVFERNWDLNVRTVHGVCQHLTYQALVIVQAAKNKISTVDTAAYNERNIDILSALQMAEQCFYGPATNQRCLIARLSLSIADPTHVFSGKQLEKLGDIISRLEQMIGLRRDIDRLCNGGTFLSWHQSMLPTYLKQAMDGGSDLARIKYVIGSQRNISDNQTTATAAHLRNIVTAELCATIETNLRLDVHERLAYVDGTGNTAATIKLSIANNNAATSTTPDIRQSIALSPTPLRDTANYVVMGAHIEHYLSNMFYNLTTVSLHDWRTYREMRCLADMKFQLKTVDDRLPTQTLEQGLDVLEIMRNIHVFVAKYQYNMNNQVFVERESNNKHLNTINIRHVANSLRTHGAGIINTTVNFTYQFLRKKFAIFSQFLYDELIKSRLAKDLKYFRDNRERLRQMYGYDRAEQFCRGIRKLGCAPGSTESYLDLFRQLITHIGNAMGFVRMMRSGGIHCGSTAGLFLPPPTTITMDRLPFRQMCEDGATTAAADERRRNLLMTMAADNLEYEIRNLSSTSIETTDYFRLLVIAFAGLFRDPKNHHLRNFYLIIPPLTLNYVEYMLRCKDKLTKKTRNNVSETFTDDGFPMGLAYILQLLNQSADFNSLYWFKSVRQKYEGERAELQRQRQSMNDDEKLQQTMSLTEKRINAFLEEFDLLYCNLGSAKNFFPVNERSAE